MKEIKATFKCYTACVRVCVCVQGWLWMRLRSSWALSFRSGLLSDCSVARESCSCSLLLDDMQSHCSLSDDVTQTQQGLVISLNSFDRKYILTHFSQRKYAIKALVFNHTRLSSHLNHIRWQFSSETILTDVASYIREFKKKMGQS